MTTFYGCDLTLTFTTPTPTTTSFLQVVEWLKAGKKIRNVKWEQGKYIHIVNDILVDQNGHLVQNICFNIVYEVVKPLVFKDLKQGQKFIFNSNSTKIVCTKLNGVYYHCPEYNVYTITNSSREVTLV